MNEILQDLASPRVKKIILDTDTYNEIDDQFALAYAMLSPERIEMLSINAAPFLNSRSTSAADGMEKSYNEIFNIRGLVDPTSTIPVYRGSDRFLSSKTEPVESEAADNIINTVMNSEETIYVVAVGAITNVASAIIKCPEIVNKCVLVWLGGNSLQSAHTREFNMFQDLLA
jgi:inosine-uridine nucleoside N-ribohydrolase